GFRRLGRAISVALGPLAVRSAQRSLASGHERAPMYRVTTTIAASATNSAMNPSTIGPKTPRSAPPGDSGFRRYRTYRTRELSSDCGVARSANRGIVPGRVRMASAIWVGVARCRPGATCAPTAPPLPLAEWHGAQLPRYRALPADRLPSAGSTFGIGVPPGC